MQWLRGGSHLNAACKQPRQLSIAGIREVNAVPTPPLLSVAVRTTL